MKTTRPGGRSKSVAKELLRDASSVKLQARNFRASCCKVVAVMSNRSLCVKCSRQQLETALKRICAAFFMASKCRRRDVMKPSTWSTIDVRSTCVGHSRYSIDRRVLQSMATSSILLTFVSSVQPDTTPPLVCSLRPRITKPKCKTAVHS